MVRFFVTSEDTVLERRIALHMRNQVSKEIILKTALAGEHELTVVENRTLQSLDKMKEDGILSYKVDGVKAQVTLENKEELVRFLKKYRRSFIDSIAYSIFRMLDEA